MIAKKIFKKYISLVIILMPKFFIAYYIFLNLTVILKKKSFSCRLLILDKDRFREDEVALSKYTDIEFFELPIHIQDKINALFIHKFSNNDVHIYQRQLYLIGLIKIIFRLAKLDGFISCGVNYARNADWEVASYNGQVPFFCLYREGVGIEREVLNRNYPASFLKLRKFMGHKIFVSTRAMKEFLIDIKYIDENRIIYNALPRFDLIVNNDKKYIHKDIVLFSFMTASGVPSLYDKEGLFPGEKGFVKLFNYTHGSLASLATKYPMVNFYIKPKWYGGKWQEYIDTAVKMFTGKHPEEIDNLIITDSIPAQVLIRRANLVVAFNSVTAVEGLLSGVNVMLPYFHEADNELKSYLHFDKYRESFCVARTESEYCKIIESSICKGHELQCKTAVDSNMFEETVGSINGKNSIQLEQRILALIREIKGH